MRRNGIGYVVLRADDAALVRHDSDEAAIKEADRLAQSVGGEYVVLKPIRFVRPAPKTEHYGVKDRPADEFVGGEVNTAESLDAIFAHLLDVG